MRHVLSGSVLLVLIASTPAAEPAAPLVEKYLHTGQLVQGEQALEAALAAAPKDDQLRFGLGVLRFVRGVERLGQSLYEYGVKAENTNVPFLRLPVPENPQPNVIRNAIFRRILDDFRRDLAAAEETLAGVTDDHVKLPLRLAQVRLDLTGDRRTAVALADLLKKLLRRDLPFLKDNPDFLVCFDRGDVAWLRAYCHLLMAMLDGYLAFDTEELFDSQTAELFARPRPVKPPRNDFSSIVVVAEPARLGRCRRHLVKVCELNRETWKHIRAETDDDHEWLPNPRQTGVLGLPVRDEMIDAWLGMMGEFEAVLNGQKVVPNLFRGGDQGINLRKVMDDPPERLDFDKIMRDGVADKYLEKGTFVDFNRLTRIVSVFDNPLLVAYAAWFN